jgi:hypothetical protein
VSRLYIFGQVTLDDVRAELAARGLEETALVERLLPILEQPSVGPDVDLTCCLTAEGDFAGIFTGEEDETDAAWLDFYRVMQRSILTGSTLHELRSVHARELRRGQTLLMSLKRTLPVSVLRRPWDQRDLPSATLGGRTSIKALAEALRARLLRTVGGRAFVERDPVRQPLVVLTHTLGVLLGHSYAQRSRPKLHWRVVRPDVYEDAAESLGLLGHFQTIRSVLEIDHPDYVSELGLGVLEYRGHDQHLVLNAPHERVYVLEKS